MLRSLFRKDPSKDVAITLYDRIVEAARQPAFYEAGLPDTVDGRFEALTLHVWLVLRRLKREGAAASKLSQALLDTFFRNMDGALREMGVGDLVVGKKIRKLAESFYGRMTAYDKAVSENDFAALDAAIARNILEDDPSKLSAALSGWAMTANATLEQTPFATIEKGELSFPAFQQGSV